MGVHFTEEKRELWINHVTSQCFAAIKNEVQGTRWGLNLDLADSELVAFKLER